MLEIFLLVHLGKRLAAKARGRGWPGWPWAVLLVPGWFGGLLVGVVAAHIIYTLTNPGAVEAPLLVALLSGYANAALVAFILFTLVGFLPMDPNDEEEEYEPEDGLPEARPVSDDPYSKHDRRYTSDNDEERRTRRR